MSNKEIIRALKKTIALMELHEENAFKIRSFQNAVFSLEKAEKQVSELEEKDISSMDGIGKSIASFILDMLQKGESPALTDLLEKTPDGVVEMLDIKGLGPKKIKVLWQEVGITTVEDLFQACENGEIAKVKGFGEKTQESILQALKYSASNVGKYHFAAVFRLGEDLVESMQKEFPNVNISLTGEIRRKMEILDKIEILIGASWEIQISIRNWLQNNEDLEETTEISSPVIWKGKFISTPLQLALIFVEPKKFSKKLLETTSSRDHLATEIDQGKSLLELISLKEGDFSTEEEIYQAVGAAYIPAEMREGYFEWEMAKENKIPKLLELKDLKGILHNHSTYSDGKHTLREMAEYCKELGYQYLGISDHSKTAFYANGLDEARVKKQQEEIDLLNKELAPFRIFKGIESDILNDGALDYAPEVLASFDFIVSSIHSPLNMDINKATDRLLKAIHNPFTTMLGHPTGRLLLRREGYPIDHKAVIDACAEQGVIIEINSHPWRLDLDWRWVHYAIEKGVMLSINPDAHEKVGYTDMEFGVYVGRKGGLTAKMTFNALSTEEVAAHFQKRLASAKSKI